MFFSKPDRTLRFLCRPEDDGVIPRPVPAKSFLPDWFRKLKPIDEKVVCATDNGLTVKRCMPFLDAMTTGWIIPLAADVRIEISDGGKTVNAGWDFDRTMVSNHGMHQVAGNPREPSPPCKFHNYWTVVTPPGWSTLFVQPLNRPNGVFEVVAGIVDTDTYASEIHFPFFASGKDGLHLLERGMPMVQAIPFRRDQTDLAGDVRSETAAEAATRKKVFRQTLAGNGWYRRFARAAR
jgi:hypothetical protein